MRTAVDVGGTFTDVVAWDGARLRTGKVTTTPDQSAGVIDGLDAFAAPGAGLVHGTTAATNAVLQRSGARTVLVTDAGFEDLVEIGRQDRPSLYDLPVRGRHLGSGRAGSRRWPRVARPPHGRRAHRGRRLRLAASRAGLAPRFQYAVPGERGEQSW